MTLFDIILVVIIAGFVLSGFWFGFIQTLGSLIGTVAGALAAGKYYSLAVAYTLKWFAGNELVAKIICFIGLYIIISNGIGLVFWILNTIFKWFTFIPLLKTMNRLAGALLGFAQSVVGIGVILYFAAKVVPPSFDWFYTAVEGSDVAQTLLVYGTVLVPLLPEAIKEAKSVLPILQL